METSGFPWRSDAIRPCLPFFPSLVIYSVSLGCKNWWWDTKEGETTTTQTPTLPFTPKNLSEIKHLHHWTMLQYAYLHTCSEQTKSIDRDGPCNLCRFILNFCSVRRSSKYCWSLVSRKCLSYILVLSSISIYIWPAPSTWVKRLK